MEPQRVQIPVIAPNSRNYCFKFDQLSLAKIPKPMSNNKSIGQQNSVFKRSRIGMGIILKPALFPLCVLIVCAAFVLAGKTDRVQAQAGNIRATHGAWQVSCGKPPGANSEKCALVQSVTAEDRPNVGLTVIFLKSIDGKKQLLRVVAPLGVLLPTGLGLKIDDKDVGHAPFLKCGKVGCIAEVVVNKELVAKLQSGATAVFIIFQTPEAGIGIPISLKGFSPALAALK